jgi:antitoxin (DNA-binding transcriptional repressor) of toxin-antitoxin stability system
MENIIGLKEFRLNIDKYAKIASKGKSITIFKRSKPLFKVSAVEDANNGEWEEVIDFTKIKKGGVKIDDILTRIK